MWEPEKEAEGPRVQWVVDNRPLEFQRLLRIDRLRHIGVSTRIDHCSIHTFHTIQEHPESSYRHQDCGTPRYAYHRMLVEDMPRW